MIFISICRSWHCSFSILGLSLYYTSNRYIISETFPCFATAIHLWGMLLISILDDYHQSFIREQSISVGIVIIRIQHHLTPWWRHQMEPFSASLALCAENSPVIGEFPIAKSSDAELWFFFICPWMNGWVNNREAGDLTRHCAHYDVIVMHKCRYNRWLLL